MVKRPFRGGGNAGFVPDEMEYLREYYGVRGWDWETGRPTAQKLAGLGLDLK
ncbi:MAG: aldehyde ferredoxin oxidoreductase C-terminal domain-containing protein [Desulfotomaculales bacterium]